jgi:ClpP class serine protease
MSGGTLIALSADEIIMDPNAVLGPVDPQLSEYPAASVLSVLEEKPPANIDDKTFILAYVGRKAINQVGTTVREISSATEFHARSRRNWLSCSARGHGRTTIR